MFDTISCLGQLAAEFRNRTAIRQSSQNSANNVLQLSMIGLQLSAELRKSPCLGLHAVNFVSVCVEPINLLDLLAHVHLETGRLSLVECPDPLDSAIDI